MAGPVELTKKAQCRWAEERSLAVDVQGYTHTIEDNLFQTLSADTRREFEVGDGGELGSDGRRGKMQALHSSSALACNVFEYWRHRDAQPLAHALGLAAGIGGLRFEQKFPSGLPGNAPNLDVVLTLANGITFAIESKFLETYGKHASGFKAKYFEDKEGLWKGQGFEYCQALAQALQAGARSFRWLHAEQLLKHILGLSHANGPWHLHYLWYRVDHAHADAHEAEVEEFRTVVERDGIRFSAQTYQSLFANFTGPAIQPHAAYVEYLRQRYFPARSSVG